LPEEDMLFGGKGARVERTAERISFVIGVHADTAKVSVKGRCHPSTDITVEWLSTAARPVNCCFNFRGGFCLIISLFRQGYDPLYVTVTETSLQQLQLLRGVSGAAGGSAQLVGVEPGTGLITGSDGYLGKWVVQQILLGLRPIRSGRVRLLRQKRLDPRLFCDLMIFHVICPSTASELRQPLSRMLADNSNDRNK
jgi:hypothetical protein